MVDRSTEMALPSVREVFEAFLALSPQDVGIIVGLAMWCAILYMPLTRIDRRDRITQMSYAAFMAFSGAALVLAANKYLSHAAQLAPATLFVVAFGGLAALRWLFAKKRSSVL
jgi:hypothetical protein